LHRVVQTVDPYEIGALIRLRPWIAVDIMARV
jgi:hypothetical protein